MSWHLLFLLFTVGGVGAAITTVRDVFFEGRGRTIIKRKDSPFGFWVMVAAYLVFAFIGVWMAIH